MDVLYLNPFGLVIRSTPTMGRGVFGLSSSLPFSSPFIDTRKATRPIPAGTLVDISPVLLFSKEEYEAHGKHTVLDHYTFVWKDGRMALALGLGECQSYSLEIRMHQILMDYRRSSGSMFNHSSDRPNVAFSLDRENSAIKFTTSKRIQPEEELYIFYGPKLWFPTGEPEYTSDVSVSENPDAWGGLRNIGGSDSQDVEDAAEASDSNSGNPDNGTPAIDSNIITTEAGILDRAKLDMPFSQVRLSTDDDYEAEGEVKLSLYLTYSITPLHSLHLSNIPSHSSLQWTHGLLTWVIPNKRAI